MEELNQIEEHRYRQLEKICGKVVEEQYAKCVQQVIAEIMRSPKKARLSGDDSVLDSFWEEFKYQVQCEDSPYFEVYEEAIRSICRGTVVELPREVQGLLWLWTDAYIDLVDSKDDDGKIPFGDRVEEALEQELYSRVLRKADTEDLKCDPDDERNRERFEEDTRPYLNETDSDASG